MTMQAIKCKSKWMQGRIRFVGKTLDDGSVVGPAYGFEDPDAAPFLLATGFFVATDDAPDIVYSKDEIDIDPAVAWAKGTPPAIGKGGVRVMDGGNG